LYNTHREKSHEKFAARSLLLLPEAHL